mmetsp:Transcript_903/g.2453  ORF Transcript_903/g.2453 Transcript_903/m.2453 type:complete len:380 (-) Transcript_903:194-1333(-)
MLRTCCHPHATSCPPPGIHACLTILWQCRGVATPFADEPGCRGHLGIRCLLELLQVLRVVDLRVHVQISDWHDEAPKDVVKLRDGHETPLGRSAELRVARLLVFPKSLAAWQVRLAEVVRDGRRRPGPPLRDIVALSALPGPLAEVPALAALVCDVRHELLVHARVRQVGSVVLIADHEPRDAHGGRVQVTRRMPPVRRVIHDLARFYRHVGAIAARKVRVRAIVGIEGVHLRAEEPALLVGAEDPALAPDDLRLPGRRRQVIVVKEDARALLADEQEVPLIHAVEIVGGGAVQLGTAGLRRHALRHPLRFGVERFRQRLEVLLQLLPAAEAEPHLHVPRRGRILLEQRQRPGVAVKVRLVADVEHVIRVVVHPLVRDA